MKLYVWKDTGGYGAGILIVAAPDIETARQLAEDERARREAASDAARDSYWKWHRANTSDKPPYPSWERWQDETEEGKAASLLPDAFMLTTEDEPVVIEEIVAGVLADCEYYE